MCLRRCSRGFGSCSFLTSTLLNFMKHPVVMTNLGLLFVSDIQHEQGIPMHLQSFLTQSCGYQHCPDREPTPLILVPHQPMGQQPLLHFFIAASPSERMQIPAAWQSGGLLEGARTWLFSNVRSVFIGDLSGFICLTSGMCLSNKARCNRAIHIISSSWQESSKAFTELESITTLGFGHMETEAWR